MMGLVLYLFFTHVKPLLGKKLAIISVMTAIALFIALYLKFNGITFYDTILVGFRLNKNFWLLLFQDGLQAGCLYLFTIPLFYYFFISMPFIVLGIACLLRQIPVSVHEKTLQAVHKGHAGKCSELKDKVINKKLAGLKTDIISEVVLGISKYTGKMVTLPDKYVNQLVLVLGTTGAGKTITLRRFYERAFLANYPLIIVDGKPTEESVAWLQTKAMESNKPFFGFNCGNYCHYDAFSHGKHTELKDKVISLKDEWASDYYRSIAEDYLQTAFEVLLAQNESYDLRRIVDCLDYDELVLMVRTLGDKELEKRVKRLSSYERKDITGLQAHLNMLLNAELGSFFTLDDSTFSLQDVIQSKGVAYFALPALRYPTFAKVLGKLVINDIKTVIDRNTTKPSLPIYIIFDEFSVFAGEQVLNLVNMGREKGVHALFGTQGLADLKQVNPDFTSQVLNCINTIICHRLNDPDSAESIASWAGTREVFDVTAQIDMQTGGTGMGSVSRNKEFILHPDEIKQGLGTGEAFIISKVGGFKPDKLKVKFS